jgi:hypothetical protein
MILNCDIEIVEKNNIIYKIKLVRNDLEKDNVKSKEIIEDVFNRFNESNNYDNIISCDCKKFIEEIKTQQDKNLEDFKQNLNNNFEDKLKIETEAKVNEINILKFQINQIKQQYENELKEKEVDYKIQTHNYNKTLNYNNENEIIKLKAELESKQIQIDNLNKTIEFKLQQAISQTDSKFRLEINQKNIEIINLKNSLDFEVKHAIAEKELEIKSLQDNINMSESELKHKYDMKIKDMENEINLLKSDLSKEIIGNNKTQTLIQKIDSVSKVLKSDIHTMAECGESFVYDTLHDYLYLSNDFKLERVNGQNNACDIFLSNNQLKCAVEVKNHSYPIKSEQINRFINTDIKNENYNAGIFISLKTKFVNTAHIKHFDIKIFGRKPVVFLAEFVKKKEHIILAVNILNYIVSNENKSKEEIDNIVELLNAMLNQLQNLQKNNNNAMKILRESNQQIDNMLTSINKVVKPNSNIDGEDKFKFKCLKCKQGFNKKVELNKHCKMNEC